MKKTFILLLALVSISAFSQFGTRLPSAQLGNSKWTFGGYAGLSGVGSGGLGIYLTPRLGYKITDHLEAGVSGNQNWSNSTYYNSTMIGVGPFANYYFGRSLYISGQMHEFFINQKIKSTNQKLSTQETALYIGGGYMQKLGEHAYMQIGGMYNLLYKEGSSVFGSGFIPQIGIVYGL